jgi:hypothetical protein
VLSNAQGKLHKESMSISSMEGREGKFIEVSEIMNEDILGSVDNKAQWKMPTESKKGESLKIGTINIENYHGQNFLMDNFSSLVEHCIIDVDKRQKWWYAVNIYNSAMVILHQKNKYTAGNIF